MFDVLSIDGHDTIDEPYEERRRLLGEVLDVGSNWAVPALPDRRRRRPCSTRPVAQELEGVMAKRLGTRYRPGARSKDWRKVKNRRRAEVVIGGYTPGTGNRSSDFGALLVGRFDRRRAGVRRRRRHRVHAPPPRRADGALRALRTDECPFDPPPPTAYRRGATWVRPTLRAIVEITEFTNEGYVRQASFIDLVDDAR